MGHRAHSVERMRHHDRITERRVSSGVARLPSVDPDALHRKQPIVAVHRHQRLHDIPPTDDPIVAENHPVRARVPKPVIEGGLVLRSRILRQAKLPELGKRKRNHLDEVVHIERRARGDVPGAVGVIEHDEPGVGFRFDVLPLKLRIGCCPGGTETMTGRKVIMLDK